MEKLLFYYVEGKEFGVRMNNFDWSEEEEITSPRGNKSTVYATFKASVLNLVLASCIMTSIEMVDKNRSCDIQWDKIAGLKVIAESIGNDMLNVNNAILDIVDGRLIYDVPTRKRTRDNFDEIMDAVDEILDMMD